jgi:hypothetical protein
MAIVNYKNHSIETTPNLHNKKNMGSGNFWSDVHWWLLRAH